jgi:very-short-patch-repair endonuclease
MKTDGGLCASCGENDDEVVWVTDENDGTVSVEFDSQSPDEGDDAAPVRANDGSETATETEDGADGDSSASGTESTPSGAPHAVDPFWDVTVDTSSLEAAVDDDRARVQRVDTDDGDPLDRKIDNWKAQLLDLTRRSNLVDFSVTKTKSLPFHRADPRAVADRLLEYEPLFVHKSASTDDGGTLPDEADLDEGEVAAIRSLETTASSLNNLRLQQKRFQRERGVDALFVALGTLRWFEVDHSDSEHRTPLFLVSVSLEGEPNRVAHRHDYEITSRDANLRFNPALRKLLSAERGIHLPPDEALDLEDLETAFAFVEQTISGFDRWRIVPETILGIFDFSKFGLYADLEENRAAIKDTPFVQAINGDPGALPKPPDTPSASALDETVSPADTYQVLDADSSQQEAIEAAKRGSSFVLQGPPGTGKSQTIANIIAEKMAAGETVLFVSEKQAALDVVKDRLDDVGLGRFCLEAHGEKATKKGVLENLERELDSPPLASSAERETVVSELADTRETLNRYEDQLFYTAPGQAFTAYDAFGTVANHDDVPRLDVGVSTPTDYTQEQVDTVVSNLESLAAFGAQLDADGDHPWQHTTLDGWRVDTRDRVESALADATGAIETLSSQSAEAESMVPVDLESTLDAEAVISLLRLVAGRPAVSVTDDHLDERFYDRAERLETLADSHRERVALTATLDEQYDDTFRSNDGASLYAEVSGYGFVRFLQPSFWRLRRRLRSQTADGYDPNFGALKEDARRLMRLQTLDEELESAEVRRTADRLGPLYDGDHTDWDAVLDYRSWLASVADHPLVDASDLERVVETDLGPRDADDLCDRLVEATRQWEDAREGLGEFLDRSAVEARGTALDAASFETVAAWLREKQERVDGLQTWIQYTRSRDQVREGPAGAFLDAYIESDQLADDLVDTFERTFYAEWLDSVYDETGLESFSATEYDTLLQRFRELDQQQREYAKVEIQHRVTTRRPQTELKHASSSAQVTLRREIQKSRRHMPLRELFDETAALLTTLKPVFMMSPLSVAQYLKYDSISFDTVVFDEASQIMPEDAISSLIRGDQVIIAGDSKQLPPTSFFQTDTEAAEGVQEDLESILDEATTVLPEKRLLWHYRSRTSELIEFSNLKYYNGALQTFPDNESDERMGVEFEFVEDGVYDRGGSSTNRPEADRVLEFVRDHIENRSSKSLGVIAFSSAQARAIREVVEQARESDPALDAFVSADDALEGFFVKSLENVQGDERDALIFSVGYGPDRSGKTTMNFGPLNQTGGERRLNVAVTRAKELVQVVSSIHPGDIDLSRTNARGVEDFKHYLAYAKRGERALAREDTEPETLYFDSEFEEAVYTALERRGHDIVTQVESSGYSIDLAIKHPDRPGEYLLGIECDGAAYHSSKTARDRDRTRQMVLEDLGWRIHRIWSPDWTSNRGRELKRIETKVQNTIAGEPSTDGGVSNVSIDPVVATPIPEGERGGITDHVSQWQTPSVGYGRDRSLDEVPDRTIAGALSSVVDSTGPVEDETAFRATIERWHISRLGKNIDATMRRIARSLQRNGGLQPNDGFLWPGDRPDEIPIRVNSGRDTRSIDEIPLEELAYAATLVLEAGQEMTRDDLVLEVARLFEYSRRGQRIKERIGDAVDLSVRLSCATKSSVGGEPIVSRVDADANEVLLDSLY